MATIFTTRDGARGSSHDVKEFVETSVPLNMVREKIDFLNKNLEDWEKGENYKYHFISQNIFKEDFYELDEFNWNCIKFNT